MARFLCAWELGAHLGHTTRLLALADELSKRGHSVDFIVRDLHSIESVAGVNSSYRFFQAPRLSLSINMSRNPSTFSEILQCNGYLDSAILNYMVKAWRGLFDLLKPDCIIYDYAPTALIASRHLSIPKIELGTGYFIHPKESPTPTIGTLKPLSEEYRQQSDNVALESINTVLNYLQLQAITHLYELFSDVKQLLASYSELDCYANRTLADYVGIITTTSGGYKPNWDKHSKKPAIFAYLKQDKMLNTILHALKTTQHQCRVYIPNASKEIINQLQTKQLHISATPYDMKDILDVSDIVICHAGHDTVAQTLLKGKPLLLSPQYIEQLEIAKSVGKIKAGLTIDANDSSSTIIKKVNQLINESSYKKNAEAFAKKYRERTIKNALFDLITLCEKSLLSQE